jgi:hypothetical protein
MTKNELIAENKWLRERAEKAEAALAHTEEAARMYCERTMAAEERMQKAEAELASLNRDAWICADWCTLNGPEYAREAANRILEATKEEPWHGRTDCG